MVVIVTHAQLVLLPLGAVIAHHAVPGIAHCQLVSELWIQISNHFLEKKFKETYIVVHNWIWGEGWPLGNVFVFEDKVGVLPAPVLHVKVLVQPLLVLVGALLRRFVWKASHPDSRYLSVNTHSCYCEGLIMIMKVAPCCISILCRKAELLRKAEDNLRWRRRTGRRAFPTTCALPRNEAKIYYLGFSG